MICVSCGTVLRIQSRYCPKCGTKVPDGSNTNQWQIEYEAIMHQRLLLAIHRRNLALYLRQLAQQGGMAYVQPVVLHGIHEARENISRIKEILRGCGAEIQDYPDDVDVTDNAFSRSSELERNPKEHGELKHKFAGITSDSDLIADADCDHSHDGTCSETSHIGQESIVDEAIPLAVVQIKPGMVFHLLEEIRGFLDNQLPDLVSQQAEAFLNNLSRFLATGLIEQAARPSLVEWRDGSISTIAALQGMVAKRFDAWLVLEDTQNRISDQLTSWIDSLEQQVIAETEQICIRNGLSVVFEDINVSSHLSDLTPISSQAPLPPLVIPSAVVAGFLGYFVGSVVGVLISVVFIGGFLGGIIALVAGLAGAFGGTRMIWNWNVPLWIRKELLPNNKIDDFCEKGLQKASNSIYDLFKNDEKFYPEFTQNINSQIRISLYKYIEETITDI